MIIISSAGDYIDLLFVSIFYTIGVLLSRDEMYEFWKMDLWKMTHLLHYFEI